MKWLKSFTLHHAPQCNLKLRNEAVFERFNDISDPHVHRHFSKISKAKRIKEKKKYPSALLALCKDMSQADYSDVVMYDVEKDDEADAEDIDLIYRGFELDVDEEMDEVEEEEDDDDVFFAPFPAAGAAEAL